MTEISGAIKWFNASKGYGFVTADDGRDILLHVRCLRAAGHGMAPPGSRIRVDAIEKSGRLQAASVLDLELPCGWARDEGWQPCTVKWFNRERGYGFLVLPSGAEVFLHARVIQASGVASVTAGQLVAARHNGNRVISVKAAGVQQ